MLSQISAQNAPTRPVMCGDNVVGGSEQCDDGNVASGDGCGPTCQFEEGYMCTHHWRNALNRNSPGSYIEFIPTNKTYAVSETAETCIGVDICRIGTLWRPANVMSLFQAGVALPPEGFYCSDFCRSFPAAEGYAFNDKCEMTDIDECAQGLAQCDYNSYCENEVKLANTASRGYSCRCEASFFAAAVNGMDCTPSGVEISVVVAGAKNFDPSQNPPADSAKMQALRSDFIDAILTAGYTTAASSRAILLEAVVDHPPTFIAASSDPVYAGRALWQLSVRIASVHANYAMLSDGSLFRNADIMQAIFNDNTTVDSFNHELVVGSRCSADYNRPCSTNLDCLGLEECVTRVPDIVWGAVEGGSASSPIGVQSSGFSLISVVYDSAESAWKARVRYDHTIPGVINVLYLPHITKPVSAIERATFRPDEFPCLPAGEGEFQKRRQDSLCCLSVFKDDYTTVAGFDEYISDPLDKLGKTINDQGACVGDAGPPSNKTRVLLDTTVDFVEGPLNRMPRSHASRDPTQTRGYRDILLYLAAEDMRRVGGIESNLRGGYSLRFFIGMAHIKPLDSTRLHTSFSHVEVTADVTQAYVFTSSSKTDYTFIRDISVSLVQITNKTGGTPLKFARVQLTVPPDVNANEAIGIIPANSARVSAGYSLDSSRPVFYPCVVSLCVYLFTPPYSCTQIHSPCLLASDTTTNAHTGLLLGSVARRNRPASEKTVLVCAERHAVRGYRAEASGRRGADSLHIPAYAGRVGRHRPRGQ